MRIFVAFAAISLSAQQLPPASTPGALNPAITQANIKTTVCAANWTKTVRPSATFTDRLKQMQMRAQGLPGAESDYEEDHRVPLEIGGNPTDPANLWPQPWAGPYGAHQKDKLENAVKRDVCAGKLTLDQGRTIFLGDFWAEYIRRFGKGR
jgi:hypothetical protein